MITYMVVSSVDLAIREEKALSSLKMTVLQTRDLARLVAQQASHLVDLPVQWLTKHIDSGSGSDSKECSNSDLNNINAFAINAISILSRTSRSQRIHKLSTVLVFYSV